MNFDYDYLVVGSGFGGSVSALRLAEKGWRVGVVEQGRRIGPEEIRKGKNSVFRLLWNPTMGMKGYFHPARFPSSCGCWWSGGGWRQPGLGCSNA